MEKEDTNAYEVDNNTLQFLKISIENIFAKISVSYDPLSINEFKNETAAVFSNGNQVMVSNVKSNTTIAIYAITGALVKTIETNSDTNFNLNSGFYIAKVKSSEGEKSVKLLVR